MHGSKKSKRFSALLALIFVLQLVFPSGTFAAATDISGHWSQESLERMISLGIMAGYTDGSIKPDNNITRAEFITIVNKAFGIETTTEISFTDVKDNAWYYQEIAKAVAAGITKGTSSTTMSPDAQITRQDAIVTLGNVFELQNGTTLNFSDSDEISSYARGFVSTMQTLGVIRGRGNGRLEPKASITRAEAAKILDLMLGSLIKSDESDKSLEGNVLIVKKGVALKNTEINGNLYITGGVGDGSVTLDTVNVSGKLIVQGGGSNTIKLANTTAKEGVQVNKSITGQKIHIEIAKDTTEKAVSDLNITVGTGAIITNSSSTALGTLTVKGQTVTADVYGSINDVNVIDSSTLNVKTDAVINKLTVDSTGTAVLSKGSSVEYLIAESGAAISVEEGSSIKKVQALNGNVTITLIAANGTKTEKIIKPENLVAIDANGNITEPDTVIPSSGGSGSGGGSGGSSGGKTDDNDSKPVWKLSKFGTASVTSSVYSVASSVYKEGVVANISSTGTSEDDIVLTYITPYYFERGEYKLTIPVLSSTDRTIRAVLEKDDESMETLQDEVVSLKTGNNTVTIPVSVMDSVYANLSLRLGFFNDDGSLAAHKVAAGIPVIEPDDNRFNNKLANGDFSNGTNGWWGIEEVEGVGIKTVGGGSQNPWDVMCGYYEPFEIKKGRTYSVSFSVYSEMTQDIRLQIVNSDDGDRQLALKTFTVYADGITRTLTLNNFEAPVDCMAKIAFMMGGAGSSGETYAIKLDNVKVCEVPDMAEVRINGDFENGADGWWGIETYNGMGMKVVEGGTDNPWAVMAGHYITFNLEKSKTYTVSFDVYSEVTQDIKFQIVNGSNNDSELTTRTFTVPADGSMHTFTFDDFKVPEDCLGKFAFAMGQFGTMGETYKIFIDNIRITYPNTSATGTEEDPYANMLKNADFSQGNKNWNIYQADGSAVFSVIENEAVVNLTNTGTVEYAVQFYQDGIKLYKGNKYKVSFKYKANVERTAEVRLQQNGGQYTGYLSDTTLSFTNEWQQYEKEFTMEYADDPLARFLFNLGQIGEAQVVDQKFYFDDFSIVMTEGIVPKVEKLNPIRLNQVGYRPNDAKTAFVVSDERTFKVYSSAGKLVLTGNLPLYTADENGNAIADPMSGDIVRIADFSALKTPGDYYITVRADKSPTFKISEDVYDDLTSAALKLFYYQRCGGEGLDVEYVGDKFAHEPCHTGTAKYYNPEDETYGSVEIDVSGGWHDAGDYGRYITPASKTVADLLLTAEYFPSMAELDFGGPDKLLDEARYEIEWMLKMQNPETGGVYHKVTTQHHAAMTALPEDDNNQLYLSPVSAQATGDFASVMAYTYRMYNTIDPDFASLCLTAAKKAWNWLEENPEANAYIDPAFFGTGAYNDSNSKDERFWSAAELYRATGDEEYLSYIESNELPSAGFGWADMGSYGLIAYLNTESVDKESNKYKEIKDRFINDANAIVNTWKADGYKVALDNYVWGSNKDLADRVMILIIADKLAADDNYKAAAMDQLHYFLGRNANAISYVTGFGDKAAKNPHHRQSVVLNQAVPGMLVGGPNADIMNIAGDPVAEMVNENTPPAKCYADVDGSFATNEICIYWNSPFVFFLGYLND